MNAENNTEIHWKDGENLHIIKKKTLFEQKKKIWKILIFNASLLLTFKNEKNKSKLLNNKKVHRFKINIFLYILLPWAC